MEIQLDINLILQIGTISCLGGLGWLIRRLVYTIDSLKQEVENQKNNIIEIKHTRVTVDVLKDYEEVSKQARKEIWITLGEIKERLAKLETNIKNKSQENEF